MALTVRTRQILLGAALAATLIAVAWEHEQTQSEPADGVVAPVNSKTAHKSSARDTAHLALDKLRRADDSKAAGIKDVFQVQSWYVPPPPPPPALPPPPPAPPPLPFAYLGQLLEDGRLTVFLTRQDQNYAVKTGDTLDGMYRVDSVEAQRVMFTYLPLNMQQSLAIGNVN
ncbi:MAG TPA: secretion system X translation initiation factor [Sulfuriferula sp.]|nr:secretion system X translation initiation factor [Sulfuriferula sp.]